VPQALLHLFADLSDLVTGQGLTALAPAKPQHMPAAKPPNAGGQPGAKTSAPDSLSEVSTAAGLSTGAHSAWEGHPTPSWFPSARVLDALRTVDSLQRSPLLLAAGTGEASSASETPRSGSPEVVASGGTGGRGYERLDSDSEAEAEPPKEASLASPAAREGGAGGWQALFPATTPAGASPLAAAQVGSWQDQTPPSWASAICRQRGGGGGDNTLAAPVGTASAPSGPLFSAPLFVSEPIAASAAAAAAVTTTNNNNNNNMQLAGPQPAAALPIACRAAPAAPSEASAPTAITPASPSVNPFDLPVAQLRRAATPPAAVRQNAQCARSLQAPALQHPAAGGSPQARQRGRSPARAQVQNSQAPERGPLGGGAFGPPPRQALLAQRPPAAALVEERARTLQASEPVVDSREWEVDPSELRLEELLGTGSTAEVYKASWHGTEVAVKRLRSSGQLSTEFKREIAVLLRLRHPNLVLFMGACTQAPQALIISEFCAGGTVFALLHQRRDLSLQWSQRLRVALDVAKGMNFLHRRQVVHRDLKSLNLLLVSPVQGAEDVPSVKVSDFGLSRAIQSDQAKAYMTSGAGTYHWMAPEVLSGHQYDEKVDVYSYGICLFEIVARRIPYDGSGLEPVSIAVAVSKGRRPDAGCIPQDCPADLRFTMECCWAQRPSGRPGFDTILETLKLVRCP